MESIYTFNDKQYQRYTVFNPAGDIVHIKHFEQGSELGLSPIDAGKEAIGMALAQEEFAGKFLIMVLF